jgi:hypothetical protein
MSNWDLININKIVNINYMKCNFYTVLINDY